MKRAHLVATTVCLAFLLSGADDASAAARRRLRFASAVVNVPPQTVEVMTRAGDYTAVFQNEARLEQNGRADGFLELTAPSGELLTFRVVAGTLRSTDGGRTATVWLLLRDVDADPRADLALAVVRGSAEHQDCLIYDLLGPTIHTPLRIEAEGRIAIIRN